MDKKSVIIIAITIILVAIIAAGTYFYLSNQGPQYQNINLTSTCSLDIPVSDNISNKTFSNNITVLNDTEHDVAIVSYNSAGDSLSNMLTDGSQLAALRDSYKTGSEQMTIANQTVWYNENTGYYMAYFSNETHDNFCIVTKDKEILEHMIQSVEFADAPDESQNTQVSSPKLDSDNSDDLEDDSSEDDFLNYEDDDWSSDDSDYSSSSSTSDSDYSYDGGSDSGSSSSDYDEDYDQGYYDDDEYWFIIITSVNINASSTRDTKQTNRKKRALTEEEKIERAQNRLRGILSEMPVRKALLGDYITVETLQKHVRNTTGLGTAFVAGALGYFVVETTEEMRWKRARLEFRDDTIYLYNPKKSLRWKM